MLYDSSANVLAEEEEVVVVVIAATAGGMAATTGAGAVEAATFFAANIELMLTFGIFGPSFIDCVLLLLLYYC